MYKTALATLMKVVVFHVGVIAQIHVKSNGVGIGTNTPTEKLHVAGKMLIETNDGVLNFSSTGSSWQYINFYKGGQRYAWTGLNDGRDYSIRTEQGPGNIFLLPKSGRVIIESDQDNSQIGGAMTLRHGGKMGDGEAGEWTIYNMKGSYGNSLQFWSYSNRGSYSALTLADGGNVGIGTMAPAYKLHVNGEVKAVKYWADGVNYPWPDYVFDSAYKLLKIPEVEKFIQQNHHLPEVPSAETIKNQGIDLASNQAVLLKKIEELTLYVIEQHKKIEMLEAKMKAMEEKGN